MVADQSEQCNEGKHFFINSEYCDKCNANFDEWYANIIKETQKDTCIFMLAILQSIINEMIVARQLKNDVGSYIYEAVRDQFTRKWWIE
jgi:hypothetical protein